MYEGLKKHIIWLPFVLLLVLVLGWLLLRDNGGGAEPVRDKLDKATTNQYYITTQIEGSAEQAGELRKEISSAREEAADLGREQRTAGEIIAECQSILKGVRARNK